MNRTITYLFISLFLVVLQTTVARLLSLEGITPDLLVIWVVYLALTEGQLRATVWAFGIGLCMDLISGDFLGLSALTKTLCAFVTGYFYNENKTQMTLGSYRFLLIVLFAALFHNLAYFLIFTLGTDISFWRVVFQLGLTTTLYTATVSLIPMFAFSKKLSMRA